jgi:hypothetical protein
MNTHGRTALLIGGLTAIAALLILPSLASAGTYYVAQCSPPLNTGAADVGYSSNSEHFSPIVGCSGNGEGLTINHVLVGQATGTEQGKYGAFVFQAPAGTCIVGGTAYSRLATENGIHGYVFASPDSGAAVVTQNQNDDQLHLSAIPGGCWRYFGGRLECTQPNQNGRCVNPTPNAHMRLKQVRLQLSDPVAPTESVGGSMFSGSKLRSQQTVTINAADQGAGVRAVSVVVNGQQAAGDDLMASCNPLPENMTSRLQPCPLTFAKTYTLNTEAPPFVDGANTVSVCVSDYATDGHPNTVCDSRSVFVDALCPASPRTGGTNVTAGFGNGKSHRVLLYGKKALIRGRVLDDQKNGIEGAQVCVEGHMMLGGRPFRLLGTPVTNQAGGWSFKLNKGASRELLIAYRANGQQVETSLTLHVRARATLHVSKQVTRDHKKIVFTGKIPGPACAERVIILKGSVPGARRSFLVRRARTDGLCGFRMFYRFSPVRVPTKFVFVALVPQQAGYPYIRGRSHPRFIKVRPCGKACKHKRHHKHKQRKQKHHKRHHHAQ